MASITDRDHESLVVSQFGPQAEAYVRSATHAQGEDLQRLAAIGKGHPAATVLDLGCGGGHVAFALAPHVKEVIAYDLCEAMLVAVKTEAERRGLFNIRVQQGPAESLPFGPASFDCVMSRFSAHHWSDLAAGLAEARRVLEPDGRAVFVDSISPGPPKLDTFLQAFELFRDPSHVRSYSEDEWRSALTAAGFVVTAAARGHLRNEFGPWIERMRTPSIQADAILALQRQMPAEVRRHFGLEADGSFLLDTCAFEARCYSESGRDATCVLATCTHV